MHYGTHTITNSKQIWKATRKPVAHMPFVVNHGATYFRWNDHPKGTQYVAITTGNISRLTFGGDGNPSLVVFGLAAP
ncbi:hypothetical protein WKW80_20850 [Variovorax humicola]|uniref:Uncharacterized protein n=1 Tax=Variovorax humicola TaxID=1769758 RepID=A0ABU8W319_9BURK